MNLDLKTVWSGDVHGPDRGLLAASDCMFPTREAPVIVHGGPMINRTKPTRTHRDPTMEHPRRAYHQDYYRRRKADV